MKVLYERVAGIDVHKDMAAPRGALLYPRFSREEFGGIFLGLMAYLEPKSEGNNSMVRREALHRIPCGAGRNLVGCFWV